MATKSVAMATYNGEKYIYDQLKSILDQTVKVDEVIICDDGSSDSTVEIIEQFISEHGLAESWSVTINSANLGYASNFMKAACKAKGDLIFFCDQDDIWLPDRVEKLEEIMEAHKNIMVLGSEFEPFYENDNSYQVPGWELKSFKYDGSLEHIDFKPENVFIGCQGCTMSVRRELILKGMKYWYEGWAHDEFVWRLALCLDSLFIYHSSTLRRRMHTANASLGKMHNIGVRLDFLEKLYMGHVKTLKYACDLGLNKKTLRLLIRNKRATELRISLLRNRKILNVVPLGLFYLDCFHKKRAIVIELLMSVGVVGS